MQEFQELTPDEETFRRVWARVMPDEASSPIAVRPPAGGERPPVQPRPPRPERPPEPPMEGERLLRQMLEMLDEGIAAAGAIMRRQPWAWPLLDSLRTSAAQARPAWFLMTGRRWEGRFRPLSGNVPLERLLREQYIREVEFSRLCREGENSRSEELREISPALEDASRARRRMIRNLLARI